MGKEAKISFLRIRHVTPTWSEIVISIEKLDKKIKLEGLHAVSVFRKILGEGFFTDYNHNHPLQRRWRNLVPWQITELSEWAKTIEKMQGAESSQYLYELLRKRDKCEQEGIHFLKSATLLLRGGFTLEFRF